MKYSIENNSSHARPWLLFCSVLFFASCGGNDVPKKSAEVPLLPIHLEADTTWIYIDDFLADSPTIDSILWENGQLLPIVIMGETGESAFGIPFQPSSALGFVQLWSNGAHREVPVFKSNKQKITVHHLSYEAHKAVQIMGGFTGWQGHPITLTGADGMLSVELTLDRGLHPYQLIVDGVEQADPSNPRRVSNGFGGWNSILQVGEPIEQLPLAVTHQVIQEGTETNTSGQQVGQLAGQSSPAVRYFAFWDNEIFDVGNTDSTGQFKIGMPAKAIELERSHIRIWTANDYDTSQEVLIPLEFGEPIQDPSALNRFDRQSMIMYFLMIDRFKNGNAGNDWKSDDEGVLAQANHFGGDFDGISQSLGYFDSLGINTIWVSPITPNPDGAWGFWSDPNTEVTSKFSGYHGYWPIQSTGVDRRFGTWAEFSNLVNSIHDDDKNILVDYVANHVHQEHPVYQKHPDWVTDLYLPDGRMNTQLWDEQRLTTWFDTFMPTLDLERPEVYETMTDSAVWWIQHAEIDGFRHDATKHIPEVFWRTLTKKVRSSRAAGLPPVFQIGETYGSPSLIRQYISNGMLDAQFDFNLYDALVASFIADSADLNSLISIAEQSITTYGAHHLMGNITGNQDRPRFASLADKSLSPSEDTKYAGWTRNIQHQGDLGYVKMSWLMAYLMASPGIPCIYYGDEIADVGGNDPDNRRMMRFEDWNEQEQWMWNWTANWIQLRKNRMSLMYGQTNHTEIAPGLLGIQRTYLNETTWVLINTTKHPMSVSSRTGVLDAPLLGKHERRSNGEIILAASACIALHGDVELDAVSLE